MAQLKILYLEDDPIDCELVSEHLRSEGLDVAIDRVDTLNGFEQALKQDYSLILSDYAVPGVDALEVLRYARQTRPDLPFIFLSGTLGEDIAIETLKLGATDYVLKQRLNRLTPSVRRALQEAEAQSRRRQAEEQLARVNEELERKVRDRTASLQDANHELEHFSYTIAHDMRAPLRAMKSFAGLVEEEAADKLNAEQRDYLHRITAAAERMDNLIRDTLNYSKISKRKFVLKTIDVEKLLRDILNTYPEFQAPMADIRVQGMLPPVLGAESPITQCFSNLLNNAIKFVRPGEQPQVKIWAEDRGEFVRLWFEDNGIGIAQDQHQKIFEMFQRIDVQKEGTGVGLTLVQKSMERMGGKVGLESEPDKGSRFWLEFRRPEPEDLDKNGAKTPQTSSHQFTLVSHPS